MDDFRATRAGRGGAAAHSTNSFPLINSSPTGVPPSCDSGCEEWTTTDHDSPGGHALFMVKG